MLPAEARLQTAASKAEPIVVAAATRALQIASSPEPSRATFITRGLQALVQLSTQINDASLEELTSTDSDYETLLRALEQPEALDLIRKRDPLAPARLRGLQISRKLLDAEGGAVQARDVAAFLGISRQAVAKRRQAGTLIGVDLGRRGYAYPAWQFTQQGLLPGLRGVLAELRGRDPWTQLAFMLTPNSRLHDETPLAQLHRGNIDAVKIAARWYGEQGCA